MAKRKDIATAELNWDPGDARASLESLYCYVTDRVNGAITWYLQSKRSKKRSAIWLRGVAIVLASGAAVMPILSQILGPWRLDPAWASVVLVAAGMLVAFDCFLGSSSGWARYVVTELRLVKLQDEFQIDWHRQKSAWAQAGPDEKQVADMCQLARQFVAEADRLILEETNAWVMEFQRALAQIDALAKTKEQTQNGSQNA